MYSAFLSDFVFSKLKKEFGDGVGAKLVCQHDVDNKHRTVIVKETTVNFFNQRIDIDEKSPKMANVWPVKMFGLC